MRLARTIILAVALAMVAAAAHAAPEADDLDRPATADNYIHALREADAAAAYVWSEMPFLLNKALLVSRPCKIYGGFEARQSNILRDNDPLLAYLEPIGYKYREIEDGLLEFGISVDVLVMDGEGRIVLLKDNYLTHTVRSRYRLREFFLNLNLPMFSMLPGPYFVTLKVRDLVGKGVTTAKIAVEVR